MRKIVAVLAGATVALQACGDRAQRQDILGPMASVQTEATGTQIIIGDIGPASTYALYRPAAWNGDLVLYAHGSVPPTIPARLPPDAAPLRDALVARGYAFAYSSRDETGFALKDGVQRTRQLRGLFAEAFGEPEHTYVMGTSMGGAIALRLAETNPGLFDGAVPMCTFAGGSQMEFDYIWNTRAVLDYLFPGVIPGDALNVPDDLDFSADVVPAVRSALLADPVRAMDLAAVDQIDIHYASFTELVNGIVAGAGPLGLQVNFTNDLLTRTHGHSWFNNTATVYTGSLDDAALNAGVDRFVSSPDATNYVDQYYQPDGNLTMPVLTLHTTRDPAVPFAHEAVYAAIVAGQGKSDLLVQRTFDRFGHCTFTNDERVRALEDLVAWVEHGVKPASQPQAAPVSSPQLGSEAGLGSKIVFASDRDGPDPAGNFWNQEIYVMNGDGTDQRRLTDNGAIDGAPVWSPNGRRIAFHSTRANPGPPPRAIDIFLMNADGTEQSQLTNLTALGLGAVDPAWSPDGRWIAFSSQAAPREVFVINVDGTGLTNLTNHPARDADPRWSPNGREIAFTSSRDGNQEIYVMNADGSAPTRLTFDAAADDRPSWSPDGTKIAFDRRVETGHFEVFIMNADGTNPTRVTTSGPDGFSGFSSWGQGRAQEQP